MEYHITQIATVFRASVFTDGDDGDIDYAEYMNTSSTSKEITVWITNAARERATIHMVLCNYKEAFMHIPHSFDGVLYIVVCDHVDMDTRDDAYNAITLQPDCLYRGTCRREFMNILQSAGFGDFQMSDCLIVSPDTRILRKSRIRTDNEPTVCDCNVGTTEDTEPVIEYICRRFGVSVAPNADTLIK